MTLPTPTEHQIARTVREAMSRDVQHARKEDSVSQVARFMSELRVEQLVVVDSRSRVLGVITQREIMKFYLSYIDEADFSVDAATIAANNTLIESLLTEDRPLTIRHDAPLSQAAALLEAHHVSCLPVVDRYEELKGMLTTSDLLGEFTSNETAGLETGFEFFEPNGSGVRHRPAFVRRANKEIVVPLEFISAEHKFAEKVMLGFDETSGRILMKFIPAGMKTVNALPLRRQADNLVIAAEEFVRYYHLLDRSTTFDVQVPDDTRYLVLVPR